MIEVKDMTSKEVEDLLGRVNYGHLGCSSNNHPYVLPIHFACDQQTIYIYTTEGKKSEMIEANPEICLQVEEVVDSENWMSVIVRPIDYTARMIARRHMHRSRRPTRL